MGVMAGSKDQRKSMQCLRLPQRRYLLSLCVAQQSQGWLPRAFRRIGVLQMLSMPPSQLAYSWELPLPMGLESDWRVTATLRKTKDARLQCHGPSCPSCICLLVIVLRLGAGRSLTEALSTGALPGDPRVRAVSLLPCR